MMKQQYIFRKTNNQMKHKFTINLLTLTFVSLLLVAVLFTGCKCSPNDNDCNTYNDSTNYNNSEYDYNDRKSGVGMTFDGKMGVDLGGGVIMKMDGSGIGVGFGF